MMHWLVKLSITAVIGLLQLPALAQATRPVPQIKHAVIISIDGLRPDLMLRAKTPNLHAFFEAGSFSFWAKTTEMSITLPSHTSMLTGVVPDKHGIKFNDDGPQEQVYPQFPTLFQEAKKVGYTAAIATSKSKFATLAQGVDWVKVPARGKKGEDQVTADNAVEMLKEHHPDILFVHFAAVDVAGHGTGWATPQQIAAIEQADACAGIVLDAIKAGGLGESTFVLISADHGGTGRWHGPDDTRARHIPWMISGPGIRKGFDLTTIRELNINTEDTFATACWLLGIPVDYAIDGRPVRLILEKPPGELMQDVPSPKKSKAPAR